MSQCLAYMGSDSSLVRYALYQVQAHIPVLPATASWGIGYGQESRMLMRKAPQVSRSEVSLIPAASDLRTRAFLAHGGWRGAPRTPESTQPHRWRAWVFTLAGQLTPLADHRAAWMETLPDFLRRNVRGRSDSELVFHRFLMHLRTQAISIQRPVIDSAPMVTALAQVLRDLREVSHEDAPTDASLMVTNGRHMLASTMGMPMGFIQTEGIPLDCIPDGDPLIPGARPRRPLRTDFKSAMIFASAAGVSGWESLAPGAIHVINPGLTMASHPVG